MVSGYHPFRVRTQKLFVQHCDFHSLCLPVCSCFGNIANNSNIWCLIPIHLGYFPYLRTAKIECRETKPNPLYRASIWRTETWFARIKPITKRNYSSLQEDQLSDSWNRVPRGEAIKVMILLKALQRGRIDLNEDIVSRKKITKMGLTFLQSLHQPRPRDSDGREQSNFPPQEPPQAWDLKLESPPWRHPFEPEPVSRSRNQPISFLIVIIKATFMSKFLVRELGERPHRSSRHGRFRSKTRDSPQRCLARKMTSLYFYTQAPLL